MSPVQAASQCRARPAYRRAAPALRAAWLRHRIRTGRLRRRQSGLDRLVGRRGPRGSLGVPAGAQRRRRGLSTRSTDWGRPPALGRRWLRPRVAPWPPSPWLRARPRCRRRPRGRHHPLWPDPLRRQPRRRRYRLPPQPAHRHDRPATRPARVSRASPRRVRARAGSAWTSFAHPRPGRARSLRGGLARSRPSVRCRPAAPRSARWVADPASRPRRVRERRRQLGLCCGPRSPRRPLARARPDWAPRSRGIGVPYRVDRAFRARYPLRGSAPAPPHAGLPERRRRRGMRRRSAPARRALDRFPRPGGARSTCRSSTATAS